MRKNDIKPGVVYAYQRSSYGDPDPCVLVSTDLYTGRNRYDRDRAPFVSPAGEGAKPGKNYLDQPTGYVIVLPAGVKLGETPEQLHARLLAVTTADLEASKDGQAGDGLYFDILTRLNSITGLYDEVMAERKAREKAEEERWAREREETARRDTRAAAAHAALFAAGVKARYWDGQFTVSLADAEKLAALLSSTPVPGTTPERTA